MINVKNETYLKLGIGAVIVIILISLCVRIICKKQKANEAFQNEVRDLDNQRFELDGSGSNPLVISGLGLNNSIFCTCDRLENKNCQSPGSRVLSYQNGLTENSELQSPAGLVSIMPYDQFENSPRQNVGWKDPMPYDIYERNGM